jgi:heavy metal translocating P-type ATPase
MECAVVHTVSGRVRLRVPAIQGDAPLGAALAEWLGRQKGVSSCRVNVDCASVVIYYDAQAPRLLARIQAAIRRLTGLGLERRPQPAPAGITVKIVEFLNEPKSLAWPTVSLALAWLAPSAFAIGLPLMAINAIPTWKRAYAVVRLERRLNVDFLDSLATLICIVRGQLFTGAFMLWMIRLGDWIRDRTAARSKRAIQDLLQFQTTHAWLVRGARVVRVAVHTVRVGQIVVVYPGEMIPVDGEVLIGDAAVEQSHITGESLPVQRGVGDSVYASTSIREGKLRLRATRVGDQTTAAQIVRMVEEAPAGETRVQNYAERFADKLVTPALALAAGLYGVTRDMNRLLSILIVDYGTGIRVAAPTAVLAAMTHAARQGILIKGGSYMERLASLDTIVFDKTGTLTCGVPEVLDVISYDERHFPSRKIVGLAAAAEARLKHPVSQAIVAKAQQQGIRVPARLGADFQIGLGVEARVNGYYVHIGSERYFRSKQIRHDRAADQVERINESGCSTLLFAVDGTLAGLIPYADRIRPESRAVIRTLHNRGVRDTVMLTGDNRRVAAAVADRLGIDRYFSDTLPAEKAEIVRRLQEGGRTVAMVGDGINDSPALAYADVGIAMKNGAEVARETADVILMEDNLWKLIGAIDASKEAMALIRQNYAIIAILNTLTMALAIPSGLMTPDVAALLSNGSAIAASLNAIRPILRY